jgi:hypothetical protein
MMRNLALAIAVAALALVSLGALAYATASHSTDGRFAGSWLIKVGAKPVSARTDLLLRTHCLRSTDMDGLGVLYAAVQCRI